MKPPFTYFGVRFGRLLVIEERQRGQRTVLCRCDCGTEKAFTATNLRAGKTTSCGCVRRETTARRNSRHGLSGTPEHNIWKEMRQRCRNPKHARYADYGGRGITVCQRWDSFASFLADMGQRPPGLTLERTNNDRGYEPGNCRWATYQEQRANQRPRSHA